MKHYMCISATDATLVCQERINEIKTELQKLRDVVSSLPTEACQHKYNWGDVGTLSHVLELLEEINESMKSYSTTF